MARVVDLTGENLTRQRRKERNYGTKTDLSSTTVERGNTHWAEGSNVNIDGFLGVAGTQRVTGLLDVTGTLNSSGVTNLSGVNNLSGENHLTGPTDVAGDFEIIAGGQFKAGDSMINPDGSAQFGALGIAPDGTLTAGLFELRPDGSADFGTFGIDSDGTLHVRNDLNVESGGRIFAGDLMIEPAVGGQINFAGGSIAVGQFGMLMNHNVGVSLQGPEIDLTATKTRVNGHLEVSGATTLAGRLAANEQVYIPNISNASSSSFTPNVYIDPNGKLWRTPWTPA